MVEARIANLIIGRVLFFLPLMSIQHSPQMSDFPQSAQFRWNSRGQTKTLVMYVHTSWPRVDVRLWRCGWNKDQILDILSKVVCDFHLPLNEPFPCVEGEYDCHVLANYGNGVGLFVQRKSRFDSEEVLKWQRRLCLSVLITIFRISVQLQVEAVWKENKSIIQRCFS